MFINFKKYLILTCIALFAFTTYAQNGLEKIIVEKYYISDENDTLCNSIGGSLPIGSVTYRIYVDMLPGYKLHTVYGNKNHDLFIKTDTKFFNNAYVGNVIGNVIPRRNLKQNTVMLDSWLSVGAAGENLYGIMKEDDDTIETVLHEMPCLQNSNPLAGIPLTIRDGLRFGINVPRPTFFKLDSTASIFNTQINGSILQTNNGAWGCLGGAFGHDSLTNNRILIAQLTTNGTLSFELNIQVGKPNSKPEKYVARNPIDNEVQLPSLIYSSPETKSIQIKKTNLSKKNSN
jgi:hypothetical protein